MHFYRLSHINGALYLSLCNSGSRNQFSIFACLLISDLAVLVFDRNELSVSQFFLKLFQKLCMEQGEVLEFVLCRAFGFLSQAICPCFDLLL